jgi:hypothetical protein
MEMLETLSNADPCDASKKKLQKSVNKKTAGGIFVLEDCRCLWVMQTHQPELLKVTCCVP